MTRDNSKVIAYILVEVPAKRSGGVVEALRKHANSIKEAYAIFGDKDVIVKVEVNDVEELEKMIFGVIQSLPAVKVTRTFIAARSISFSRD